MSPQQLYQELVKEHAAPLLKSHGFRKSGMNFGLRGDGVWGVLTFWKDKWNTSHEVRFSVTLNTSCDVLRELSGWPFDPKKVPDSSSPTSQWHTDIGPYLKEARQAKPYSRDAAKEWWEIRNQRDFRDVKARVLRAIEKVAIPEIRRRQSLAMIAEVYRETRKYREAMESEYWLGHVMLQLGDRVEAKKLFAGHMQVLQRFSSPALPRVMKELTSLGMD